MESEGDVEGAAIKVMAKVMAKQKTTTTTTLQKHYLTLYEKCQLAYNYEKLVMGVSNKTSLCRKIGIEWNTYYYMKYILETNYDDHDDGQGRHYYHYCYKDKLEKLKDKLSRNNNSTTTMEKDVPTSITFMDGSAVSIWLDPSKTNNHFGNTVIYGTQHLICVELPNYCK